MLFWAKKTAGRGVLALVLLLLAARGLSAATGVPLTVHFSAGAVGTGIVIWLAVVLSDLLIHAALTLVGGSGYRAAAVEFQSYLRGMPPSACLAGGLVAALGEEPLFRGVLLPLFSSPTPLAGLVVTALLFGAAHYLRPSLRLIAVWAAWQGFLLGSAYLLTGSLAAVMVAHFLHDTTSFFALSRR